MKLKFNLGKKGGLLEITKEPGDPIYRNGGYGKGGAGESRMLYHIKKKLNGIGFDLIKKRMNKDKHLVSEYQQYLRCRGPKSKGPHIIIMNGFYQIEGAEESFNDEGETGLQIVYDIYGVQPDCIDVIRELVDHAPPVEVRE